MACDRSDGVCWVVYRRPASPVWSSGVCVCGLCIPHETSPKVEKNEINRRYCSSGIGSNLSANFMRQFIKCIKWILRRQIEFPSNRDETNEQKKNIVFECFNMGPNEKFGKLNLGPWAVATISRRLPVFYACVQHTDRDQMRSIHN